jgi:hypothetical protein
MVAALSSVTVGRLGLAHCSIPLKGSVPKGKYETPAADERQEPSWLRGKQLLRSEAVA